jgi:hypothetical protein
MKNYSICYLDSGGRTQNSEFLPFEDNGVAVDFARLGLLRSAIVEVWKDGNLVSRLLRDPAARVATAGVAANAVRAFARADSNEGESALPREGTSR